MTGRTGRARGELRQLLCRVFGAAPEAMTWRAAAAELVAAGHLPSVGASELLMIRRTVENMARAGELVPCGHVRQPGSCRPMTAYQFRPVGEAGRKGEAWLLLADAMRPRGSGHGIG